MPFPRIPVSVIRVGAETKLQQEGSIVNLRSTDLGGVLLQCGQKISVGIPFIGRDQHIFTALETCGCNPELQIGLRSRTEN